MPTTEVSSTKITYFDPTLVVSDAAAGLISVGVMRKFLAEISEGKEIERSEGTQWLHWESKKLVWKTEQPSTGTVVPPWLVTFPSDVWDSLQMLLLNIMVKGA